MADIFFQFPINSTINNVFKGISSPLGLDKWWTKESSGELVLRAPYTLSFGPEYKWLAKVTKLNLNKEFELTLTKADTDWLNPKVGFSLNYKGTHTELLFYYSGWENESEHFKISSYCWAMYLRILKRNLEFGETVSYENRLDV